MFKKKHSFSDRLAESNHIRQKYPDRVPIILEPDSRISLSKKKYLVSWDLTMGQFIYIIRNRVKLASHQSLLFLTQQTVPSTSELIKSLYERYKDRDGFLYMNCCVENVFG
jgi:GABA(A) receptor-associated protein